MKNKKVLIIGSKGMAGHLLKHFLVDSGEFTVADLARGRDFFIPDYEVDVENREQLSKALYNCQPDFVINCVGVLNEAANDNPSSAIFINAFLPHYLAKIGNELSFKLIHISTDCVFSGGKGGYVETDQKDGKDIYAQTKSLGEVDYGNHLTIRTSIIGPELKMTGIGLLHWFFMQKNSTVKGYSKAFWSGVTTFQLAKFICDVLKSNKKLSGLIHLTNNEKINKHDLLMLIKEEFGMSVSLTAYENYVIDKSLISSNKDIFRNVPSYKTMIYEMKQWMEKYRELYEKQYSF